MCSLCLMAGDVSSWLSLLFSSSESFTLLIEGLGGILHSSTFIIFNPQPPEYWDYRYILLCSSKHFFLSFSDLHGELPASL